jgi:hypothetical protein
MYFYKMTPAHFAGEDGPGPEQTCRGQTDSAALGYENLASNRDTLARRQTSGTVFETLTLVYAIRGARKIASR